MDSKRKSEIDLTGPKRQKYHEVAPVSAFSHGYEVFLSFMGEDTRKGFTDHLYHQLIDAGISVFKDDANLPFGGEISISLSKAIEISKIGLLILSKNYAASRCCLDELVCMLECMKTKNQTVLPIFYDVTPSQVRHQTGSYADAFNDHANKYDEETRKKWRKALAEVTSLKGWELEKETGGHEGQLIKKILGKILVELKKTLLRLTESLVGIDDQGKEVKALLDTNDVRKVVGLWGMGGIGKTTLAKFIYNQILDKFESCSFLGDIRENSLKHGLAFLQSRLVSDLSRMERRDFSSVKEGVNHLSYMFHEKKVLILLDDVDHIDQLKALAAEVNWFGPGSRIVVTTRDKSILDDLLGLAQERWWAYYEVKEMNKEKALELFCKHAFRQGVPEDKLSDLSHAIVETAGGIPLALEVIGSFLSRKRMSVWEETLEMLKKMPKQKVQERLKISLKTYMTSMGSKKQNGYEVFLSFMGGDTRKGFVDHLYEQMVDAGIMVFKDNVNLPDGEEISTSLSKAIELSKIAIPIFSKNYANSRWCLDEVVCMLECRNTMVVPIFYDVTPSQVKHQKGSYATAFNDHANTYDEETREKWRKSLAEVSSFKGLELAKETGGLEGQLTKKILAKVLVELKKNHLRLTDKLVRIDDQEKKVKDLLAIDANDVRKVVGLWGMGGIGKTTLAKFIYNQILDKFEARCFLNDISEKSLECNGLECLQSQLVSDLSRQRRRDFSSVDEGVNHLEYMFREKKVLILLDDVDNINQLEALAANTNWFGPGSRIIVTTRNRSILDDKDIDEECCWACYEVKEMNKEKALKLFCKHAFIQDSPQDEFSALSHEIIETTGGLPLALEVIGSCLFRKRMSIWEETLEMLKKMPKLEVQERLKISYERLDDYQKQMFLDVACLFIGEDIDIVMHVWKDRDFYAETGKDALLVMSLIKIVDNKIWMHDQLRDLGREIVRKENYKEPGKRSRLWQDDEARAAIANNSMVYGSSSEVEALALGYAYQDSNWIRRFEQVSYSLDEARAVIANNSMVYGSSSEVEAPTLRNSNQDNHWITSEQLRNHSNIWFLKLDGVNLTGDFQHLLSKLIWLSWQCSSEHCPPTNLNLEKLIFLDLSFSCITDDSKLWSSFQRSMKLKVIKLEYCIGLITLDVSTFINLENLFLAKCELLKKISVGKLNCTGLGKLPRLSKLKSLKMLDCSACMQLREIEGLDQLEALEELNISWCEGFKKIPNLSKLKSLKRLSCAGCEKLEELEGLGQLEALEGLNLSKCVSIEKLLSLSKLKSLKKLNCCGCLKLQDIEGLDQLKALEDLNLSQCEAIEKLSSISKLKSLKILDCSWCEKLQEIVGLDELEKLQQLNLSWCTEIGKLPCLSKLKSLKMLNCGWCLKLQVIEGLDQLEELEFLNLTQCSAAEKMTSFSMLKSLKMLDYRM